MVMTKRPERREGPEEKTLPETKSLSILCRQKLGHWIIMNPRILRFFVTERGKIIPRRISGNCANITADNRRLKRARNIALLPFTTAPTITSAFL